MPSRRTEPGRAGGGQPPRRDLSRREFLRRGALGLGGCLWGWHAACGAAAPSNRLNLGCIGLGAIGGVHLTALASDPRVELRAVCDVDRERLRQARGVTAKRARGSADYRELLATPDLEAVLIATPDHQHATMAVAALRAGCDVYVEKPLAWGVAEGRAVVDTARRLHRIVQVGTQQRAQSHFRQVVELVRSGRLGEVKLVRCWKVGTGTPKAVPDSAPPAGLDWDRWLGPAPWRPFNAGLCPYHWRWYWDFGGGYLTDWGVHLVDIVHWAMGEDRPRSVEATGTFEPDAPHDTPATMDATFEYRGFRLSWSQNGFRGAPDRDHGILFYGSKGRLLVDRNGFQVTPGDLRLPPIGPGDFQLPRVKGHFDEFLTSVRSRSVPSSDAAVGHAASTACVLGNLALRLGRKLTWDGGAERFVDDPEADRLLARTPRAPYGW